MAAKIVEERKAKGLCIRCGGEIEPERKEKGYQKCGICAERESADRRDAGAYRRRTGRCVRCGKKKEPERTDMAYCAECGMILAIASKKTRDNAAGSGRCVNCGKPRIGIGCTSVLCVSCADKRRKMPIKIAS